MAKDEFILAVDTSTRHCAVALCRSADGCGACDILAQSCVDRPRLHAERLLDGVHWVLDAAACPMDRVTCLAAAAGPGSFTGLRVGLATWKGLAFALQLPLVAVPTLDAMARLVPLSDGVVIPLLDARMREIFGAVYRYRDGVRETLVQEQVCPVDDLLTGGYMNERPLFFLKARGIQTLFPVTTWKESAQSPAANMLGSEVLRALSTAIEDLGPSAIPASAAISEFGMTPMLTRIMSVSISPLSVMSLNPDGVDSMERNSEPK